MLNRISIIIVLTLVFITNNSMLAQEQADQDSGFKFLPVLSKDYDMGLSLSLKTGVMNFSKLSSEAHFLAGAEAAFNCLMFKPANGSIRAQLSYNRYDDGDIIIHTVELNPYYMINITDRFSIGGGPGIGYLIPEGNLESVWGVQAGTGATYNFGIITVGLEARYQWQTEKQKNYKAEDLNNFRTTLKFGINI